MRISVQHPHFMVLDDLVDGAQFDLLVESLKRAKYRTHVGWSSLWALSEEPAFRGSPFTSDALSRDFSDPASVAYSIFVKALTGVLDAVDYLTGKQHEVWQRFNGNAILFPPGGALNWHSDKKFAASYSYYCHPSWQRRWGGELLILEERPPRWGSADVEEDADHATGVVDDIGYFVAPIPNRLVVIRGATPHRIAAVSAAAGENHRMSITGFFLEGEAGEHDET